MASYRYSVLCAVLMLIGSLPALGQVFPIPGGIVPRGGQACFPFTVSGFNQALNSPTIPNSLFLDFISVDIISARPSTLVIWIVSPNGDSLLLSAHNSFGGPNYTNTLFKHTFFTSQSIVGASAPCTGNFLPQGTAGLPLFNGLIPNGVWQLCVKDTSNPAGPIPPQGGGPIVPPAYGSSGVAGGMGMGTSSGSPCGITDLGSHLTGICQGMSFNLAFSYPAFLITSSGATLLPISTANQNITFAGLYTAYGVLANGCTLSATAELEVIDYNLLTPLVYNVCEGSNVIVGNFNFWPISQAPLPWVSFNPPLNNFIATSSFTVTGYFSPNGFCIQYEREITFNVLPKPALGPDLNLGLCTNSPFDLTSLYQTQGMTTNWSLNGTPIPNPTAATQSGNYTLVANSNGCEDTVEVALSINPQPALGSNQVLNFCGNFTTDLTVFENDPTLLYSYFVNGIPVLNPNTINVAGTYEIIGENALGCSDTLLVTINAPPIPNPGPNQIATICSGTTVDLTSYFNLTGLTPSWISNGNPVSNPTSVVDAGLYELSVVDPNGCSSQATLTLNAALSPSLGIDQTILMCIVNPFDLSSIFNTTGLTSNWSFNNLPVANPSAVSGSGIYTLIASNFAGCSDTAFVDLTLSVGPAFGANQNIDFCTGTVVDLNSIYNTGSFQYNWTIAGLPVLNPSAVTSPGIYVLIASNTAGCTDTAEATLNMLALPNPGSDQNLNFCSNTFVDLNSYFNLSGLTTSWSLSGSPVSNPSNVNASGSYLLEVTDLNGCKNQNTVVLNSIPSPDLDPDKNLDLCPGTFIDLSNQFITAGWSTIWTSGGLPVSNPSAINTGGVYQLVVIASNGCTDTANVTINPASAPILGNVNIDLCDGDILDLTSIYSINGNINIWTNNGSPVIDPTLITNSGIYSINSTNSSGCNSNSDVTLVMHASPILGNDISTAICSGSSMDLSALYNTVGLNTTWDENGIPVSDPTQISTGGTYQLIAINQYGCSDTAMVYLNINPNPDLGSDMSYTLCQWRNLNLGAVFNTNNLITNWSVNGLPLINYSAIHDSGTYHLNVTDMNGCIDDAYVHISNIECDCDVDFSFDAGCVQEPVVFSLLADSVVLATNWKFNFPGIPQSFSSEPIVKFIRAGVVLVSLEVELSCGKKIIQKEVEVEDCSQGCFVFIPSAFSPNKDEHNESFKAYTICEPEKFKMRILNRFGQVIYESTDHKFEWDGANHPEGTYAFQCEYLMPYQSKKTLAGRVSLIR